MCKEINNIKKIIREHREKLDILFFKNSVDELARAVIRDEIRQSQKTLIRAVIDELVGEEKEYFKEPNEYSCPTKIYVESYNKRVKEAKAKGKQIIKEL